MKLYRISDENARTLSQIVIIDPRSADNRASKTQEQWIEYFNKLGKPMISAPNIYQAGKSASNETLNSLRKDFDGSWVVSGTSIKYYKNYLSGRIIHNYGSSIVKPIEKNVSLIPVYSSAPLKEVLTSKGIEYVQTLFDTNDDPNTIIEVIEHLSKRKSDDIRLWTPDQDTRNTYTARAVWFGDGGRRFHGDGNDHFDVNIGHSRGVSISSRSGRVKK